MDEGICVCGKPIYKDYGMSIKGGTLYYCSRACRDKAIEQMNKDFPGSVVGQSNGIPRESVELIKEGFNRPLKDTENEIYVECGRIARDLNTVKFERLFDLLDEWIHNKSWREDLAEYERAELKKSDPEKVSAILERMRNE
jgi:hypothetical protein